MYCHTLSLHAALQICRRWFAKVRADGHLIADAHKGSIHSVGAAVQGAPACNGWTFWHAERKGMPVAIDVFRQQLRALAEAPAARLGAQAAVNTADRKSTRLNSSH